MSSHLVLLESVVQDAAARGKLSVLRQPTSPSTRDDGTTTPIALNYKKGVWSPLVQTWLTLLSTACSVSVLLSSPPSA